MINSRLISDPLENAKMSAVVSDIFRHLVVSLSKIYDAAISVTTVDKIVNDTALVAFTNQIIEDNFFGCLPEALQAE